MSDAKSDPASVWQAVLGRLQSEMPKEHFNTFLRPCVGYEWQDGDLVVAAASSFAVSWLELPLHLSMATEALRKTVGREARPIYRSMPSFTGVENIPDRVRVQSTPRDIFADDKVRLKQIIGDPWPAWCRIRTWENMDDVVDAWSEVSIARQWALRAIRKYEGDGFLLLAGAPGVGKTYLACAAINGAWYPALPVLYGNARKLANDLQELLSVAPREDLAKFEQAYREALVLLLDDFGQPGAPWGMEKVNQIPARPLPRRLGHHSHDELDGHRNRGLGRGAGLAVAVRHGSAADRPRPAAKETGLMS